MQVILLLVILGGKLDDPAPISPALVSHKLDDPEVRLPRVESVSLKINEPPAVKTPTPKTSKSTPKVSAVPVDEWRPFAANPSYEVYGHIENGVFRYSKFRVKHVPVR